ncbi:OTU domain-containing protein 6B [Zancudomyces culisetae]|uniref:OTU domain-containing protein 6B n=1 Tax=Zancudomyces culisetae TaxID=1213189 RepID=A0A1R1PT05_ZANCU|nr:OTU domain-containing protein 6B [Zancudomyces culisetae]|eukprot:OMH84125.1 OTU domain-containing protein 6B [Zancudomyces culisetae]
MSKITALKKTFKGNSTSSGKKKLKADIEQLESELKIKHEDEIRRYNILYGDKDNEASKSVHTGESDGEEKGNHSDGGNSTKDELEADEDKGKAKGKGKGRGKGSKSDVPKVETSKQDDIEANINLSGLSLYKNTGGGFTSKSQQRKMKKQKKMEEMMLEAEKEALDMPNYEELESAAIKNTLKQDNLRMYEIKADGHCLYSAISYVLKAEKNKEYSVSELRRIAGDYIRDNMNDFAPFMDIDMDDEQAFLEHIDEIKYTALWGGQIEITALSQALGIEIHIYSASNDYYSSGAGGYKCTVLKIGEGSERGTTESGEAVKLSFHKHAYGLGEHYNAVLRNQ